MWIYYCLIGIICCDFLLEYWFNKKGVITNNGTNNSKSNKALNFIFKYRLITVVALIIISTFKAYKVGADTFEYLSYWQGLKNNPKALFKDGISTNIEFLYTALNSLLIIFNLSFRGLIFAISVFVSISIVLFVNKLSVNKPMSLILYISLGIFAQTLSVYRQIIAMAIVLFALMLLIDKKWIKATVLIIIGTFFHISCLMCLLFVVFRFIKPKWWLVVSVFALTTIGAFMLPEILQFMENTFHINYYTKYFVVLTQYRNPSSLINTLYSIAIIAMFVIMYVARFKLLKLEEGEKKIYDFFLMIFMLMPLLRIVGYITDMPELLNRLCMYPFMVLIVLIPLFVKGLKFNNNLHKVGNIGVYIIALLYMYYLYAIELSCQVVPYVFCF